MSDNLTETKAKKGTKISLRETRVGVVIRTEKSSGIVDSVHIFDESIPKVIAGLQMRLLRKRKNK